MILHFAHFTRSVPYDRERFESIVRAALPLCLREPGGASLAALPEVTVSVIGARRMAHVHREFLGIPGATDVITFPYGEILVCAAVASSRAGEFGLGPTDELALYAIHGLLHLTGHDDITASEARRMHAAQARILKRACGRIAAPRSDSRIP